MGNTSSKNNDDEQKLLNDTDDNAFTQIFEPLRLVIIGCHGAGKNYVGNKILGKNVFTWTTTWKTTYVMKKRMTPEGTVVIYRAPGWSGDLNNSKIKNEIRKCLRKAIPHALILVIKVDSNFTGIGQQTLQSIFDNADKFWDHTIVLFTCGEKLYGGMIEDYIQTSSELYNFIPRNHNRLYQLKSDDPQKSSDIIVAFEDMITTKNVMQFQLNSNGDPEQFTKWISERISFLKEKVKWSNKDLNLSSRTAEENEALKRKIQSQEKRITALEEKLRMRDGQLQELRNELAQASTSSNCLQRHLQRIQEDPQEDWDDHKRQFANDTRFTTTTGETLGSKPLLTMTPRISGNTIHGSVTIHMDSNGH